MRQHQQHQPAPIQAPPFPPQLPHLPQQAYASYPASPGPVLSPNGGQYPSYPHQQHNPPQPPPPHHQPSYNSSRSTSVHSHNPSYPNVAYDPIQRPSPTYPHGLNTSLSPAPTARTQSPASYAYGSLPASPYDGYPTPPSSRTAYGPPSPYDKAGGSILAPSVSGTVLSRRSPGPGAGGRSRTTSLSARSTKSRHEQLGVPSMPPRRKPTEAEGKLSVGIDFG